MTSQMMMSFYEGSLPSMGPHGRTILRVIFRKMHLACTWSVPLKQMVGPWIMDISYKTFEASCIKKHSPPGCKMAIISAEWFSQFNLLTVSLTLRDFTAMDFYEDMDAPRQMVDTLFRTKLCKSYAIKEDEIGDAVLTMRFKKRGHTLFKLTCMYPSTLFTEN